MNQEDKKDKVIKEKLDTIFDEEFDKKHYDNDVRRRKICTVVNKENDKVSKSSITSLVITLIFVALFGVPIFIGGMLNKASASINEVYDLKYSCEMTSNRKIKKSSEKCEIVNNEITTTSILSSPEDAVNYEITITNGSNKPATLYNISSPNNTTKDLLKKGDEVYLNKNDFLTARYIIYSNDKEYYGDKNVKKSKIVIGPKESITIIIKHTWLDIKNNYSSSSYRVEYDVNLNFKR